MKKHIVLSYTFIVKHTSPFGSEQDVFYINSKEKAKQIQLIFRLTSLHECKK